MGKSAEYLVMGSLVHHVFAACNLSAIPGHRAKQNILVTLRQAYLRRRTCHCKVVQTCVARLNDDRHDHIARVRGLATVTV